MIGSNLTNFECRVPATLEEALQQKAAGDIIPIAGGTEVMVLLNEGLLKNRQFQSLHRLKSDHRYVRVNESGALRIGALATYSDVRRHPEVAKRYPLLIEAAKVTGALQIQNRGTLVGNVVNGSPAADTVPALLVYEAELLLVSVRGERTVKLTEFYQGYKKSVLAADELIAEIMVPSPPFDAASQYYRKVGTRAAQAISKVVCAGARQNGTVRLCWGSVMPTSFRSIETEKAIAAGADVEEAVRVLRNEIKPIDDIRSTGDYRVKVCGNILRDFLERHKKA